MGDGDNSMPPSKKRVAGKQLCRDDDPDAEVEDSGQETGTFQRASDDVLASRRIVKVRRNMTSSTAAANPFAAIRLVAPTAPPSVGESVAKTSETSSEAKDNHSDGKNNNEDTSIAETKAADATLNEAKKERETKAAEADLSVNSGGEFQGSEEAQLEPSKDEDNAISPSKKRVAGKQLSRDDDPDAEVEDSGQETGTFQWASDEALPSRRIVKVCGNMTSSTAADATLNVARKECETKAAEGDLSVYSGGEVQGKEEAQLKATKENGEKSKNGESESKEKNLEQSTEVEETDKENNVKEAHQQEPSAAFSSFQQLSSTQNAFAGISGTGFSSSSFSFGLLPKSGTSSTSSFGSAFSSGSLTGKGALFETKAPGSDGLSPSSASNGGASIRLFGAPASDNVSGSVSGLPALQEVPVETGEEKEEALFTADSVLFEYISGAWKERGKGELKVNLSMVDAGKARLVMRSKGNYRLILNANLFPDMKLTNMDKRGITFVCVNSAGESKENLSMFALKFKDSSIVEQFRGVVEANKGKTPVDLKTPDNSPKSSELEV